MKAAVLIKHKEALEIKNVPIPEPGFGQVLVKIHACGVCHSDIHIRDASTGKSRLNLILGHEGTGVVSKLGDGVKTLSIGDRVGCPFLAISCGSCEYCLQGWEPLCLRQIRRGLELDGCFSEYTVADADWVAKIPDSLSFEQAAPILCAGVTAYKGLKETEVKPGQWVIIIGASGGLGHLAIQYALYMGMKVLAVDLGEDKINYCLKLGAHAGVDISQPDSEKKILQITNGGAHGVLVFASVTEAYEKATKYIRRKGFLVGVGLIRGQFKVDVLDLVLSRKSIRGSYVGTRQDLQEALNIAANGGVKCDISLRKMEEVNQVLDELEKGIIKGRVVLRMAKL